MQNDVKEDPSADFSVSGILVDNTELEDKMDEFVYRYQVFAHQVGTFKEVRKDLLELQLTMTELTKELLKRNDLLPQGSKRCFGQVEDHSEVAIDSSNPKPITKKLKFAKLTPRTDLAPAFSCKLCGKKYGWLKSLARGLFQTRTLQLSRLQDLREHAVRRPLRVPAMRGCGRDPVW